MEKSPAILILPLLKSNENSFNTEKLSSFCKNTVVGRSVFFCNSGKDIVVFFLPSFLPLEMASAILKLPLLKSNENSFNTVYKSFSLSVRIL